MAEPEEVAVPRVWVLIVNWNGYEHMATCLASLTHSTLQPARVLVMDDGSTDGSVQMIRTCYPAATATIGSKAARSPT